MKEGGFILLVVLILLGITAVRYRKQIAGMIAVGRALKDAGKVGRRGNAEPQETGTQLINCSKCGVWVPENRALRRGKAYVCDACV